jgi:hypothetical protein
MKKILRAIFIPWEERFISEAVDHADFTARIKFVRQLKERQILHVSF